MYAARQGNDAAAAALVDNGAILNEVSADGSTAPQGILNCLFVDGHVRGLKHSLFWQILPHYTQRFNAGGDDVYAHFWPTE